MKFTDHRGWILGRTCYRLKSEQGWHTEHLGGRNGFLDGGRSGGSQRTSGRWDGHPSWLTNAVSTYLNFSASFHRAPRQWWNRENKDNISEREPKAPFWSWQNQGHFLPLSLNCQTSFYLLFLSNIWGGRVAKGRTGNRSHQLWVGGQL